jgi:hypothetical protein
MDFALYGCYVFETDNDAISISTDWDAERHAAQHWVAMNDEEKSTRSMMRRKRRNNPASAGGSESCLSTPLPYPSIKQQFRISYFTTGVSLGH